MWMHSIYPSNLSFVEIILDIYMTLEKCFSRVFEKYRKKKVFNPKIDGIIIKRFFC